MKTIINDIWSRQDFFNGRGMLEIGCAWLSFGAIMALEHILRPDMNVLELGSGGSTLFFADRCKWVESIETDKEWFSKIKDRLRNKSNVRMRIGTEEDAVRMIEQEPNDFYDVVLIDTGYNPGKIRPNRRLLADTAVPKIKKDGYLILDNYMKYGNSTFNLEGWEVYRFDDFGYSGKGTMILRKL